MFCPNCGAATAEGRKFCVKCGTALDTSPTKGAETSQGIQGVQVEARPVGSDKEKGRERPKGVPVWVWVAIVALVLAGAWWLFDSHGVKQRVSNPVQNIPPEALKPSTENPARLTPTSLANMKYRLGKGTSAETIELVNGGGQNGESHVSLEKDHIAFGDLDGDGVDDAVVVLISEGPTAASLDLVAVTNRNGKGETAAIKSLGFNTIVKSININGGIVTVEMLTVGPNDPMCCPATRQVLRLAVRRNEFEAD